MKTVVAICFFSFVFSFVSAQHYLRGEVKDENNNPLPNAKMLLHSSGYLYFSGSSGAFGITLSRQIDSITVSLDGYKTTSLRVNADVYERVVLRTLKVGANVQNRNRLISFTKNLTPDERRNWSVGGETYSSLVENEFIAASKFPETGFAIHTDRASYSNVRRFLNMNTTVPPDAVRIEELMNYFNFTYKAPEKDSVFSFQSYLTGCPWNPENQLMYLQVCSRKIDPDKIPPSNLVFLIDISGSMDMPNRLPLLKSAFKLLVDNLRDRDTVSIVVYGSTIGVWLTPTSGKEKEKIRKAIEDLYPGGATPGESGIRTAYRLAKSQFIKGGNNRVILATDGDFNVGYSNEAELDKLITQHQQYGIYLTCLGVGMGNYKDSKLEVLAKKGNGNFAYLDNELEAEKVLVKELTQTLYSIADDAFLSVHFNPRAIQEYRLIGYDNKVRALADTLNEIEGGEIGSGHSLLALFEVKTAAGVDEAEFQNAKCIADVSIQYKIPPDHQTRWSTYRCPAVYTAFPALQKTYQFASAVAMFGMLLKESKYARRFTWSDALALASDKYDAGDAVQKEFLTMIEKARKIYGKGRRKKR